MCSKSAALKNAMAKRRYNTVLGCLESFQAAETTNFDKSPKNKNLRIPWPSGGRQQEPAKDQI